MAKGQGDDFIADIKAAAVETLCEHSAINEDTADQLANALAQSLHRNWGGQVFYIPKHCAFIAAKRDLEIFNKFTGANMRELVDEYDLSSQYIYQIIRRVRAELPKHQSDLFDD